MTDPDGGRRALVLEVAVLAAVVAAGPGAVWALASEPQRESPAEGVEGAPKLVIDTQGFTSRVDSVDFSPSGEVLAAAGSDKVVRLWNVRTGRLLTTLRGYDDDMGNGMCQVVRYSPDGKSLVVGVQDLGTAGAIRVYDTADLSEINALLPGHPNGGVLKLAFSPDGKYLASGGADGGIIFWDWAARRPIGELPWARNLAYFGFPTSLSMLVVIDGQGFHAFSAVHGREVTQLDVGEQGRLAPPELLGPAYAAAQNLGPALGQIERQLPFEGPSPLSRFYPRTAPNQHDFVVFGGTGKKAGRDNFWVSVWTASGQRIQIYEQHPYVPTALALTADASLAASADSLGNIDLWETQTGRRRFQLGGKGRVVYGAGFDSTGGKVVMGTEPFGLDRWNYNSYASPNQSFDLAKRVLSNVVPNLHEPPSRSGGGRALQFSRHDRERTFVFTSTRGGAFESYYSLSPGVTPLCFGYLRTARTGIENLLMIGCNDNSFFGLDPSNIIRGRRFIGHTGAVYAFGESPDGRFLVSGSEDRTARIWSLGPINDLGWPDFDSYANGVVYFLKPGGDAERAGIRVGDIFTKIGGRDLGAVFDRMSAGKRDFLPGQRTEVELTREGQAYRVPIDLSAGGDFTNPLVSLFVAGGEWVLWAPSGYYDASPAGDRLIGWHVNRGRAKSARFYTAHQFRKQFFRPDVIDKILETGDVRRGAELANRDRPHDPESFDLRKSEDFLKVIPPRVRVYEPRPDAYTQDKAVTVKADVLSQNGEAIGDVKIVVNGRPVTGKDLPAFSGDTETKRHVECSVELDPGRNSVSVIATGRKSKSSSRPQEIVVVRESTDADADKPTAFVLAVGISDYSVARPKLEFAHRDAQAFAAVWDRQAGTLYARVEMRVLLNEKATVAAIRDGFDWLKTSVSRRDYAIIFFAAHGVGDASEGYYIAPYEFDSRRLSATAIPGRDLIALAEGLRCRRTLVFLDTCHAGGIEGSRRSASETMQELVSDEIGAVMFGACKPREESQEDPAWGHGAFTKALLETFADPTKDLPPQDGLLSMDELTYPLGRRVADLTGDEQHTVLSRPPSMENFDFFAFMKNLRSDESHRLNESKGTGR